MVTHDPVAAGFADRVVFLADGRVVAEEGRMDAERIARFMLALDADR
jgi:putative ABC transport system ATP-binding protein